MIDPKNLSNLTGGLVVDPEVVNDNILKLRLAVDYAGSEKGSQNTSGYFDVTYYLNNDDNQRNAKFVRSQISEGKMKKGSQVSLVGRLVQERWTGDGDKKNAKVVIVAEAITYAGGGRPATEGSTSTASGPSQSELPDNF